ncbi:hypothetical protein JTB14_028890 [Gonioctena quinquepunctata]|nr:hypothetical protein JTB14_028890 [Gonioctena quinquepunctata]
MFVKCYIAISGEHKWNQTSKYVATVTQIINSTENETDWSARHLGHDIRVHRDFYRLHGSAVELTKISRLLMAVDNGEANRFAGKKLNEIELSEMEEDPIIVETYSTMMEHGENTINHKDARPPSNKKQANGTKSDKNINTRDDIQMFISTMDKYDQLIAIFDQRKIPYHT